MNKNKATKISLILGLTTSLISSGNAQVTNQTIAAKYVLD
jgi:hypothetical protein